jgi:ABC-type nitrate/sulfonate/bicarbonate transport system ATPase subunit
VSRAAGTHDPGNASPRGAAISLRGLRHRFGDLPVLAGIDADVPGGGFVSLIGPSGCGKSTVLRVLAGLLVPTDGVALVHERSCVGRPGLVAFMPQRDTLLPWRRALANATLGAEIGGAERASVRRRAHDLFERFGLAGFERSWPSQLSGGMRQRVALLRTFLAERDVLALDEPFGALDALTRRELQAWLAEVLAIERRTCLLVTHDVDEALWLSDEVLVLSPRPAVVQARVRVPFARPRDPLLVTDPAFGELRAEVLRALAHVAP